MPLSLSPQAAPGGKLNYAAFLDPEQDTPRSQDPQPNDIDDEAKLFPTPSYTLHGLRTCKQINAPTFKLATYKLVQEVSCQDVSPSPEPSFRSQLPMLSPARVSHRSSTSPDPSARGSWPTWGVMGIPSTPSSPNFSAQPSLNQQRSYSPIQRAPLPAYLSFDSWWTEKGQRMAVMVDYCTKTKMCTASMHVCFNTRATCRHTTIPLEPWDLHVGAQLEFLGKRITLRKARNQATVDWLDQQAELMIKQCKQLQDQLKKYRPVSRGIEIPLQNRHYHNGGKLNLRTLYQQVTALSQALRQHKAILPELLPGLAGFDQAQLQADGPPDWSPDRRYALEAAERQEKTLKLKLQREAAAVEAAKHAKRDFLEWLMKIPLAASAAHLERKGGMFVDPIKAAEELLVQSQHVKQPAIPRARRGSVLALDLNSVPGTPTPGGGDGTSRLMTAEGHGADRQVPLTDYQASHSSRLSSRASQGVTSRASMSTPEYPGQPTLPRVTQEPEEDEHGVMSIPAQSFLISPDPQALDETANHATT